MLETPTSPHIQAPKSVTSIMVRVVIALLPGIVAYVWFFGWGIVVNLLLAVSVALLSEAAILAVRGRPIKPFLTDGSAVVTAMLLALAIPPLAPWWVTLAGVAFAIIIAKQLYGGLGYNPFNPAMAGYVMLLISFPREMTQWLPPQSADILAMGILDTVRYIFSGELPLHLSADAITMATPLDTLKTQLGLGNNVTEIRTQFGMGAAVSEILSIRPLFGSFGGIGWEWINAGFLAGGLWLIFTRIINWHIPVAFLGGLITISAIFYFINPGLYASPQFHIFSGAAMLGAFFIATDPVTAATTKRGQLIYGFSIGLLIYIIRTWGGYPDAVAFAVLLMNMVVPTIDYYTQPRVFGHDQD